MQHIKFDFHNGTISINKSENNPNFEKFYNGRIWQLISTPTKVFILILKEYSELKNIFRNTCRDFDDNNNIYCYDLSGKLLWQIGEVEFTTFGGDTFKHPADNISMDGDLLKLTYHMGLYR